MNTITSNKSARARGASKHLENTAFCPICDCNTALTAKAEASLKYRAAAE